MKLPHPQETLADCVWLPRHIAKVRAHLSGGLPLSYRVAFGSRIGVDGYFFRHFNLSLRRTIAAVKKFDSDAAIGCGFCSRPEGSAEAIPRWNGFAAKLGATGHSGHITLWLVKRVLYPKATANPVSTIFEAIAQDENLSTPIIVSGDLGRT